MNEQTLESLCIINPETLGPSTPADFKFRYVDISAVDDGRIDWSAARVFRFGDAPSRARRILRVGDALLCTVRPMLRAHARIEETGSHPLVASTGFAVLRPHLITDSGFIFHQLFSESVTAQLRARETGSTYPAVNEGDVKRLRLYTPQPDERHRIATVLDAMSLAITRADELVAKLSQVRDGLLHDLLTRGLDEDGQLRNPDRWPRTFKSSPVGLIPHGWHTPTLEELTDEEAQICYGIVQAFDFVPNGVQVLTIRDVLGDYSTGLHRTSPIIDANYARSRVRPGDVLVSVKGTVGRIGLVPSHYFGNISRDLARIRPANNVLSGFLAHLLRSPIGQKTLERAQVGTTRAELSIAPLKKLRFAFPRSMSEQVAITRILDCASDAVRASEQELTKFCRMRDGLMADLLTGHVRIPQGLDLQEACP